MKPYKHDEIKAHFEDWIQEQTQDWIDENLDDLHHHAFNTDYYLIERIKQSNGLVIKLLI